MGLLDDTYLAMSLVQVILDTSTEPWIEPEIHLEAYNAFAGSLLGEDFERRLDTEVQSVRQQMVIHVVNSLTEVNQSPESPREPSLDDENHSGKIDNRFLGRWNHSTYMSSGGFSFSTHRYRIFGPDGRFVEGSQAFADSVHFDASGNWSGWDTASTGRRPGDQGTWEVDGSQLGLIWDDGSYAEYQYEVSGESMLLIPSQGENQLWEKG